MQVFLRASTKRHNRRKNEKVIRTKRNQVTHKTEDNIRLGSKIKQKKYNKGKQGDYKGQLKVGEKSLEDQRRNQLF